MANELLALLIEFVALGLLCWWGFATGGSAGPSVLLGLGTPLAAGVLWWLFAAPQARLRPALPGVTSARTGTFRAGAGSGRPIGRGRPARTARLRWPAWRRGRRPARPQMTRTRLPRV
ncbi:YrdB family protein [Streptomyces sp. NRRL S-1022]|uniref:YrdB family protein n=1 Tax=Streptomyces sp. NRRL S-1022 TaxID=1463880 RepID=UPI00099C9AE0|nr:YrdB family protein [Streptomyces sp. NRRL S-1022]